MKDYELELIRIKNILSDTKDQWTKHLEWYQLMKMQFDYEHARGVIFGLQLALNQINQSLGN